MILNSALMERLLMPVAITVLLLLAGNAHADEQLPRPDEPDALVHFEAGNKSFRSAQAKTDPEVQRRDFEEAIKHYRAGAAIESKYVYTFYWNLGHAYRQLGEYTQADWFYRKFLEFSPKSLRLHRAAAEDFITRMRAELNKEATLAGPTDPAPAPIREPMKPAPATANGPTEGSVPRLAAPWHADRLGWVLAGGGLVGVLAGGGFLVNSASLYDQAAEEDRQSVANELQDRGDRRALIGWMAGGIGVGLLATGVIKLALTDHQAPATPPIQVTVGPSWFSLQGSF